MDVTAVMNMMELRAKKIMKRAVQICTTSGRSDVRDDRLATFHRSVF